MFLRCQHAGRRAALRKVSQAHGRNIADFYRKVFESAVLVDDRGILIDLLAHERVLFQHEKLKLYRKEAERTDRMKIIQVEQSRWKYTVW